MKYYFFVLSLFLYFSTLNTLDWEWVHPFPTGNRLNEVQIIDSLTIFSVGDVGTIVKSNDGGDSWEVVLAGDGMECFFDYENPEIAFASQQYGRIFRSFDGGQNFGFSQFTYIGGDWVTPFFIHTTGHDTLYAASNDIHRYPHDTYPVNVWQQITTDLSPVPLNTFVQSPVNPKNMIAAENK